ncbi:MAG: CRTAC1 family protein, partial [Bacteroidales bacterium]
MKKTLLFAAILLACTNLRAQLFTKIANQIIVEDSANNVGVAWGDYDNDGDMDLYTTVWNTSPNDPLMNGILYQNNCNGSFTKITALPGGIVSDPNVGTGAYWLDYNNDGNLDLYTWDSRDPTKSNSLFKNLGNGSFEKVNTAVSSIRTNRINCAFADFNNDGWLDFYTGDSSIYISDKQGNFTRLSPSPIFRNNDPTRTALYCSASCVDYNNDGYMDLLVIVAISQPSGMWGNYLFMYTNNGHGGFRQDTLAPPYYDWFPNYGHTWGDYDNDGNLDLWVNGNPPYPNHLFHNNGNGTFTEVHTGPVIAVQPYNNQGGASFCDYNNDGWLDLFQPTLYQNILFDNNGDGTFMQDTAEIVTKDTPAESYGAGWVDYNNDGAMDLFVPTGWANADDYLYKNVIYQNRGNTNHWLKFKCIGERSNKDAIGARIYAKATINGKSVTQMREINANTTSAGESGGASGHVVHMGFGNASFIDTLKIVWPASHTTQIFTHVPANQFLQITESVNTLSDVAACKPDLPARNPGYVTGKLFNDVNNNCTYDAGVDLPIANKLIKASPGPYYVYTDNDGNYTFSLPAGTYTISQNLQEDNWVRESCQADSFMVTVTPRDTEKNKNFAVTELAKVPCNGNYGLTIYSISVDHDNCPSNILLTNPCPGYKWEYCFRITNNTTMITPAGSVLALNFPVGYHILSVSCPCSITSSSLGTNTMNVTFNNSFVIGGQCQVCVVVHIDIGTNLPFITQATYSQSGTTTNLINN